MSERISIKKIAAGTAALIGCASLSYLTPTHATSAEARENLDAASQVYRNVYTDNGMCLDNSAFDPENGATTALETAQGEAILTVNPNPDMVKTPVSLHFTMNGAEHSLLFADFATAAELKVSGCDLPSGL